MSDGEIAAPASPPAAEDLVAAIQRLQQELDAVRATSRAKDELLATASHELRTPLNAIYGWIKMLRTGALDARGRAHAVDVIERNATAQIRLINELLDVSRVVSGRMVMKPGQVDLRHLVKVVIDSHRPAAEDKQIVLTLVSDDDVPPIRGDEGRLEQVVGNLVANAVKFTPADGRVNVHVERTATRVRLSVTDTGPGIAADLLPHVFEPFRQGENGVERAHQGLGLGLALVRHIVELHRGTVAVASDGVAKGARFTVELPID